MRKKVTKLLVLAFVLVAPATCKKEDFKVDKKENFPTTVAFTLKNDVDKEIFCSGTILSRKIILTAAQCLDSIKDDAGNLNVNNLMVVAGEENLLNYRSNFKFGEQGFEQIFSVKRAVIHPHYKQERNENYVWDLAIVEVNEEINTKQNTHIQAAQLPPKELILTGQRITFGVWEKTPEHNSMLNLIQAHVNPQEICEEYYGAEFDPKNMFCAGDKTTTDDTKGSGATIDVNEKTFLIGIVNFYINKNCQNTIGFQKIGTSLPWIFMETGLT